MAQLSLLSFAGLWRLGVIRSLAELAELVASHRNGSVTIWCWTQFSILVTSIVGDIDSCCSCRMCSNGSGVLLDRVASDRPVHDRDRTASMTVVETWHSWLTWSLKVWSGSPMSSCELWRYQPCLADDAHAGV